jgi:hypothetical protein
VQLACVNATAPPEALLNARRGSFPLEFLQEEEIFRTVAIIAALGIAVSSPVLAQGQPGWGWWGGPGWRGGPGYGMGPGQGMGPGAGIMMGGIDADQSGDNSAEEAAAHAEVRFATKDADSNGTLAMAEFLAVEKAQYEAAATDGDGKVSPSELRTAMWAISAPIAVDSAAPMAKRRASRISPGDTDSPMQE